jgi:hypothetical protein
MAWVCLWGKLLEDPYLTTAINCWLCKRNDLERGRSVGEQMAALNNLH